MNQIEEVKEFSAHTCCLCLDEDESTFHTTSVIKSMTLHEMVDFCIGTQVFSFSYLYALHLKCEELLYVDEFPSLFTAQQHKRYRQSAHIRINL